MRSRVEFVAMPFGGFRMGHWNCQTSSVPFPSLFGDCQDQGVKEPDHFGDYGVLGEFAVQVAGRVGWVVQQWVVLMVFRQVPSQDLQGHLHRQVAAVAYRHRRQIGGSSRSRRG